MSDPAWKSDCFDCGQSTPTDKMVGVGSRPDWVCLKCFELRMKREGELTRRFRRKK